MNKNYKNSCIDCDNCSAIHYWDDDPNHPWAYDCGIKCLDGNWSKTIIGHPEDDCKEYIPKN